VGGTGRQVDLVLSSAFARLVPGGCLAVNVATVGGLAAAYETLKKLAGSVQLWNVAISRGIEQMDQVRFEAVNPTYLLTVIKTAEGLD
jgi:precorrin-6Y C5,15-methyltransferase (decarboxylating)